MAISIPFPLPNTGFAKNSKVRVNLDYIVSKFNEFNTGAATWDTVAIGTPNSLTGSITLYNSSNSNYLTIQAGATSPSITYTLPAAAPGDLNKILLGSNTGAMNWTVHSWAVADSTYGILHATAANNIGTIVYDAAHLTGRAFLGVANNSSTSAFFDLKGTSNQVNIATNTYDTTLSLPQDIATNSNVHFGGLQLGVGTVTAPALLFGNISDGGDRAGAGFYVDSSAIFGVSYFDTSPGQISTPLFKANSTTFLSYFDLTLAATRNLILTDDSTNTLTLGLPSTITTYVLNFPTAQGGANEVLTNDGSGNLTWEAISSVGGATKALDNLASVAINTSLLPGTDNSISLGNTTHRWVNEFLSGYLHLGAISTPTAPAANNIVFYAQTNATHGHTRPAYEDEDGLEIVVARDNFLIAQNTTASPITKGQVVYISGSTGNVPTIALAKANSLTTLPAIGVVMADIAVNGFGYVQYSGIISNFNTSAFSTGDRLYVDATTAGALTNTRPVFPNKAQRVGSVLVSGVGNGSLAVVIAPFVGGEESGTSSDFTLGAGKNIILTDDTTGTITIALPASVTSYTLTLPPNDGNANQVLTTNGSGTCTWEDATGGGATTALDNLASVAINTSLLSDAANTDDLGSAAKTWKDLYLAGSIKNGSTTIFTIDTDAAVTMTNQPCFLVTGNGTQSDKTGDGTVYTLVFGTEIYDQANNFASTTFTAPHTGRYLLCLRVRGSGYSGSGLASSVDIVTSNRSYNSTIANGSGTEESHIIPVIADMDVNDTAYCTIQVSGGSKTVDIGASYLFFSGVLIA